MTNTKPTDQPRFVVIGGYVADCIVNTNRLPNWGDDLEVDSVRLSPGGKALNQAVALARLGAHVSAIGVVGDDAAGREILHVFGTKASTSPASRSGRASRHRSAFA